MTDAATEELQWDRPVLLIGASPDLDPDMVSGIDPHWPLIAVDGGLDTAHAAGLRPSLVLGDMDSARRVPDDVPALQLDGQDDTDLEKALQRISAPLIIGFGFLDGRLDHVLASMHAITRLQRDIPLILVGRRDVLLRPVGDVALSLVPGTRFSVWPLGKQHFAGSSGLQWPLDALTMTQGGTIGTSNRVASASVTINAGDGEGYAVILPLAAYDAVLQSVLP
ncbi:MAG: thiamine diphosphokinase [Rhodospirillaceae bacterium]|nr:thiamine diphosphokinase [Rhodospirillaceae bacterium]